MYKRQVNVGPQGQQFPTPPQGQDYVRNEDGTVKIGEDGKPTLFTVAGAEPLSIDLAKKTREEQEAQLKKDRHKIQETFASSNVGNAVDTAYREADKWGASGTGSGLARNLPFMETRTGTIDAALNTVKSNASFTALQQMRDASPTGGALGAVSDLENKLLAGTIADLRPNQSTEELKKGLLRVKAAFHVLATNKYKEGETAKFNTDLQDEINRLTVGAKPNLGPGGKFRLEDVQKLSLIHI